jgi:hypothetical protein
MLYKYVVLRNVTENISPSDFPFVAFYVKDLAQLERRMGHDIIVGDIIIEISTLRKVEIQTVYGMVPIPEV